MTVVAIETVINAEKAIFSVIRNPRRGFGVHIKLAHDL
jgi:hypothetical protein